MITPARAFVGRRPGGRWFVCLCAGGQHTTIGTFSRWSFAMLQARCAVQGERDRPDVSQPTAQPKGTP